jgi:hypothetical protein
MGHVATHGIDITGARITVHANTISSTTPVNGATPTGCGFYGNEPSSGLARSAVRTRRHGPRRRRPPTPKL